MFLNFLQYQSNPMLVVGQVGPVWHPCWSQRKVGGSHTQTPDQLRLWQLTRGWKYAAVPVTVSLWDSSVYSSYIEKLTVCCKTFCRFLLGVHSSQDWVACSEYYKPLCSVLVPDKPSVSCIHYSNWTSWILFHCLTLVPEATCSHRCRHFSWVGLFSVWTDANVVPAAAKCVETQWNILLYIKRNKESLCKHLTTICLSSGIFRVNQKRRCHFSTNQRRRPESVMVRRASCGSSWHMETWLGWNTTPATT